MTTKTWNNSSADWFKPDDWSPTGVPGPNDDVVINGGEAQLESGDAAIKVASITLGGGVLAIQDPGKTQSVSGDVTIGGGLLQLDGSGAGGSSMTIGGNLVNNGGDNNVVLNISIGNTGMTSADTVTVKGNGGLFNNGTGLIHLEGGASAQATLDVANAAAGFGTAGTVTGTVLLENDALLEFKSGQITTLDGTLQLDGAKARVADARATGSNSALTGLTSIGFGNFYLQNGAKVTTTGDLTVNFGGRLELDGTDTGGSGGSALTIGGSLSNLDYISIGNNGITSADTLTVKGAGGVTNQSYQYSGHINIEGSTTAQATLNIANAVAGFGTAGVLDGNVSLENDALLEFKSGQITTVQAGTLTLDGAKARVADAGKTGSNSALTGLTSVSGNFYLQNGARVTTTSNLTIGGSLQLDGNNTGGSGGSSLTIGGMLTNNFEVSIGNTGITSADTLTVKGTGGLSNTNTIDITGGTTTQATLNVANAAAGFGTAGVENGTVFLQNDALLEFESGQITTVNGTVRLDGASSRIADAGKTGSNSALTGLTNISGNFWLWNGAKVATTGNLSATGNATLLLDESNGGQGSGSGGSSLTIGGNLTNSITNGFGVSVGNVGITSADTVTVKGTGGLSNTGTINIQGSGIATAKVVVTHTATNSGTINIGAFGDLTAAALNSGSGTISIGASGDLTAARVDITGGTLLGNGTVTGALHVTGGTVRGFVVSRDPFPGTLTVSGSYFQSGSATLQTDINPFEPQQSSIISVTGSPGTPGASGSVNLAGGTLLINAENSLALDTPYTVMTFGAHRLYGEFGKVETEGQLGNNTGNSTSVNLGDGNTLDVLYNEANGTIQVELVATPAGAAYDWDAGSGTWGSSAAHWDPPGNDTTPSSNSNVTIGTGSGGTVTLAEDQTINSLTLTPGYTLSGANRSITTNAGVSVASGAALSLDDMNVGGVFTDSGSVTLAGVLTIDRGGRLTLSNGSIAGGINGSGTFETSAGTTGTLTNITIYGGTTFTASNNAITDISGTIGGKGTLQVNGGGGTSGKLELTGATTLSGGGVVSLTTKTGGGSAIVEGAGQTLTNANDVIEGTGTIGAGSLALSNGGTIDANTSGGTLTLNGTGGITNTKVFEATSGGILDVAGTFAGKGGAIEIGASSEVELGGATSQDATFLGASSAKLSIDNATKTTYGGVINSFVSGDILELGNTDAKSAAPTLDGKDTILTVDLIGGGTLAYTLAGDLTGDTFSVTHVGGNSDIAITTNAAFGEAHSLLGDPMGSSFVGSSEVMGGYMSRGGELNLAAWNTTGHGPGGTA